MADFKIIHTFLENGVKVLALEDAQMYDTASPYKYCVVALWEIGRKINEGIQIKIISNGNEYKPASLDEFKQWIVDRFNNEYIGGFEKYIDSETQPFS